MTRIAVVLFNLGGPDRPEAVKPFLLNLFSDPAILTIPQPMRFLLARFIASQRAKVATEIYARIGGGSPILPNTEAQARAIEKALAGAGEIRAFIAMRHWHPFAHETALAVKKFAPARIVLLPLYPQYSTATTESSLKDWHKAARAIGLEADIREARALCCYPTEPGFCTALVDSIRPALAEAAKLGKPRILFSAHGLPKRTVALGDPYQFQVERTAAAVVAALNEPALDWAVCYQSRVGRLEWIGPYAEDEIARAGRDKVPVVVVPLSFVSEHSETLVELDMTYREHAEKHGVPGYFRAPTVGTDPAFIEGLAALVRQALTTPAAVEPYGRTRICPQTATRCGCAPVK